MRGHNLLSLWFPVVALEHLIASWVVTSAVPLVVNGDLQLKYSIWCTALHTSSHSDLLQKRMGDNEADCDSLKQFIFTYVSHGATKMNGTICRQT